VSEERKNLDELRDKVKKVVRQVVLETVARLKTDSPALAPFAGGRRPLVVANWKMNKLQADAESYLKSFQPPETGVETVLCPPLTLLASMKQALGPLSPVQLGAQNLHPEPAGAHTGEHSGPMLADAGAGYVIVGHSERRAAGEDDHLAGSKLRSALATGLVPILCVGELLDQRQQGATLRVLRNQLTVALSGLTGSLAPEPAGLVVAYEPVWAIGTGHNATPAQAQEAHGFIRDRLAELFSFSWADKVRLLYGGSVSEENAFHLAVQPDVDGFLVGGAGLHADKFKAIILACGRARMSLDEKEHVP
jgi:triosephosphate isomerase